MAENTQENRKYQRFSRKLPLEFSLTELQEGLVPGVNQKQGMMLNVGKGGMCFECDHLRSSTITYLSQQNVLLDVTVFIPLVQKPLKLVGQVTWHQKVDEQENGKYIIGIKFRSIKSEDLKLLFRQTGRFKYLIISVIALTTVFALSLLYHFVLRK